MNINKILLFIGPFIPIILSFLFLRPFVRFFSEFLNLLSEFLHEIFFKK